MLGGVVYLNIKSIEKKEEYIPLSTTLKLKSAENN